MSFVALNHWGYYQVNDICHNCSSYSYIQPYSMLEHFPPPHKRITTFFEREQLKKNPVSVIPSYCYKPILSQWQFTAVPASSIVFYYTLQQKYPLWSFWGSNQAHYHSAMQASLWITCSYLCRRWKQLSAEGDSPGDAQGMQPGTPGPHREFVARHTIPCRCESTTFKNIYCFCSVSFPSIAVSSSSSFIPHLLVC